MLRVGLTGGIGSGKSTVTARLAELGVRIIDSDRLAREVVQPGTPGFCAVVDQFGPEVVSPDGTLDRSALAVRVFDDANARHRLNAIVHPLVRRRSDELQAGAPPDAVVVHDVPLLVEAGLAASFPLVVVVGADPEVRVRRLVEQRGMAPADVRARITAQASDDERRAVADVWIDNSGTRPDTIAAVDRLWSERLVPYERNLRHRRRAPRPDVPLLVAPDSSWPQQAQRSVERIWRLLGTRARRVDHIGSTAVPDLDAKDVLDLQVVVADLDEAHRVGDTLAEVGLVRLEGRWWDHCRDGGTWDKVFAANADPGRAVNCHVRPAGSPCWREVLLLRDWLRAHPRAVAEYAAVKHGLAARRPSSIKTYADWKTPYVRRALLAAENWASHAGWVPA